MKISALLYHVDHGRFSLPCFARDFVWKPSQVIGLFNSLYRRYPVGTLILWTPPSAAFSRSPESIEGDRPLELILDGQQRIAAIVLGMRGHPPGFLDSKLGHLSPLCFHIENTNFAYYQPYMKDDPHWINLSYFFDPAQKSSGETLDRLYRAPEASKRFGEFVQRLNQLTALMDRSIAVEYIPSDASLEEAKEIYLLANGGDGCK